MDGEVVTKSATRLVLRQERPRWLARAVVIVVLGLIGWMATRPNADQPLATPGPVAPILVPVPAPGTSAATSTTTTSTTAAPTIRELEARLPTTTTTFPPYVAPWPSTTTTVDPVVAVARRDLDIDVKPDQAAATVGSRYWVTVSVTNRSTSRAYTVPDGADQGMEVWLTERADNVQPGSLPGTGPSGYTTDGQPLRWYLDWVPAATLMEQGFPPGEIGGRRFATGGRDVAFAPGATRSARFAIDVGLTGPLPKGGKAYLHASVRFTSPTFASVTTTKSIELVDSPGRLLSWLNAVTTVGSDPVTRQWLLEHQGRMDLTFHGVDVDVRYREGLWELWFYENPSLFNDESGDLARPPLVLRVRAAASSAGALIEVRELRMNVPPSDDPDAVAAEPEHERVLFTR